MRERRSARIQEIAKIANVSMATVSRVLNNLSSVKEENRQKVLKVIRELNYKPNISARRLAGARNYTIGLVIPYFPGMFQSYYVMQVIEGVEEESAAAGWDVLVNINRKNESDERFYNRIMNRTYVEGMIYAGYKNAIPLFKSSDMPYIIINTHSEDKNVNCINIDNKEGAFDIVEHLISLGHKKIATISGRLNVQTAQDRLKGYCEAMEKHNLLKEIPENFIVKGEFDRKTAYRETLKFFSQDLRPTAIFAATDDMAIGVIDAIKQQGLRVPEDIAVVGFDNRPVARDVEPKLTTVHQPIAEMGRMAVKILVDIINGKQENAVKISIKTDLIIRQSCGANKK